MLSAGFSVAQAVPVPARPEGPVGVRVLKNMGDLWGLSDAEKDKVYRVRMELAVYYYDPAWRVLWVDDGLRGSFFPTSGELLPIAAGERISLKGVLHPSAGLDGRSVEIKVLAHDVFPEPAVIGEDLEDDSRWNMHWVSVEGIPVRQNVPDPGHVKVDVLSEGRIVLANVMLDPSDPIPNWFGHRIRVSGVYVGSRDSSGTLAGIALWVPSVRNVASIGVAGEDVHFNLPATAIAELSSLAADSWVRISGYVAARDQGHSLTVRDATGQVAINSQQPDWLSIGQRVDVIGRVRGTGVLTSLAAAYFRAASDAGLTGVGPAGLDKSSMLLRVADQVMELPPQQAALAYPVNLRGVVTWADRHSEIFYLQDPSAGVAVRLKHGERPPTVGNLVQVVGVSAAGAASPEVRESRLTDLGGTPQPTPDTVGLDQALSGAEQARCVTIAGYLSKIVEDKLWSRLEVTTPTGKFLACAPLDATFQDALGSFVRVTGVCTTLPDTDAAPGVPRVQLWLDDRSQVQVTQRPPADPFAVPAMTLASLRQYLAFHNVSDLCRVQGEVVGIQPDGSFYLQDSGAGILVRERAPAVPAPGASVEVVGIPGHEGGRLVLREALWRAAPARTSPAAYALPTVTRLDRSLDGTLVSIDATLVEALPAGAGWNLECRNGPLFPVHLPACPPDRLPAVGSKLALTGVYVLAYDEFRQPRGFGLELRGPEDIRVIETPSWLTARHAIAIAGGFALCTLLGVGWVLALRRRVARQTAQIREQLEAEARLRAELERAGRLESLGVLAGGIAHDFNNLLTVVIANLGLAQMDDGLAPPTRQTLGEAVRGATRASELTQQLLTFAKGGDPVRTAVSLPEVIREAAEFGRHGSNVRCEYVVEPDLRPASIDRAQFGRVVHNLVLNAAQAMPDGGIIRITLSNATDASLIGMLPPGPYVKVVISDNGPGIAAEHLSRIFEPYFSTKDSNHGLGLAAVHSIVKKHRGHIAVQSEPGQGTTFQIWLPAAEAETQTIRPAPAAPVKKKQALRVLFMDDEPRIRQTADILLTRLGHEPIMAADGAEAVKAYRDGLASGRRPEVVILDLTVPGGMGGRAAMEELRQIDPGVRAIVSSGYSSDPVMANFSAYGFKAVVAKPYDVKLLARTIQEVGGGEGG